LGRLTRASSGFPHHAGEALGRCSCLLVGDIGQLSSVMDFPLYCSVPKSAIADCGRTTCQLLGKAVVLTEVLGQDGQDSERVRFQELLLRREPIYHHQSCSQWSQYQQSIFRRRFRTSTSHLPCLWCQVMVTSNLWTEASLVNGAVGTVGAICYLSGGLPSLPVAVMVKFDKCRVQLYMMEVFQLSISDVLGYKVVVHVHGCRSPSNLLG